MHACMDGWMDACMHVCMHACMYVCMYVFCTHTHIYIYILYIATGILAESSTRVFCIHCETFQVPAWGPEGLAPGLGAGERGVTGGGSFTCGLRAWTARLHNVANLLSSHSAVMPGLWARLAGNPDSPASPPSPSMMIACFGGYVKGPARSSTATSGSNSNRWHSKRTSIEWFPQCGVRTVSVKTGV